MAQPVVFILLKFPTILKHVVPQLLEHLFILTHKRRETAHIFDSYGCVELIYKTNNNKLCLCDKILGFSKSCIPEFISQNVS